MRLLLDTHTFLWFIDDSPNLSPSAKALIEDGANDVVLSVASLWEMAIKVSIGKLTLAAPFASLIPGQLHVNDIALLDIQVGHLSALIRLPHHHGDPFDRLLVAQAMIEGMPIVSKDESFSLYNVSRLW